MAGIDLREHVLTYFRAGAGRFGLDAGSIAAGRVLNWGGFVSQSYQIGDGNRSVHAIAEDTPNGETPAAYGPAGPDR
jgi:hypothetical protein